MAVAAAVVAADQVTKTVALHHWAQPHHLVGTLWLQLTFNTGVSFGLGRGATPVVVAVVVLLICGLLVVGRRASARPERSTMVGIGLLVGGALGNLTDRLVRHHHGAVIDFVDAAQVGRRELWPVFNLADSAIVIGAIVVVLAGWLRARHAPEPAAPARARSGQGQGRGTRVARGEGAGTGVAGTEVAGTGVAGTKGGGTKGGGAERADA